MKKIYFAPLAKMIVLDGDVMIAGSTGVATGDVLGDEYNDQDVSYSYRRSIWNDED